MLVDRTLRHAEFFGSATETAQPDDCLEGAQGGEGKIRNILDTLMYGIMKINLNAPWGCCYCGR